MLADIKLVKDNDSSGRKHFDHFDGHVVLEFEAPVDMDIVSTAGAYNIEIQNCWRLTFKGIKPKNVANTNNTTAKIIFKTRMSIGANLYYLIRRLQFENIYHTPTNEILSVYHAKLTFCSYFIIISIEFLFNHF